MEDQASAKKVFQSRIQFSDAIKKDKHIFLKCVESFSECTSKTFVNKLTNKFVVLSELFTRKKHEYEALLIKVAEVFPEQASDLVEAVFLVRDDMENMPKKGMGYS